MISDTFHSGLLWAAYLLCLLLSGVQSPYPATSVVTVSANTLNTDPTYANTVDVYCIPPKRLSVVTPYLMVFVCTAQSGNSNNVRVFGGDPGSLGTLLTYSTGFINTKPAVLKDSLILVVSRWLDVGLFKYSQISVNSNLMSQSVIDQDDLSPSIAYALADEPSAAYVIGCGTNKIFRLHPDISQTVIVDVPGPQESLHSLLPIPSIDGLLVGKVQSDVPILARVNFATIKNPTYSSTIRFYLVDSVNDTALMVFTHLSPANQVRHFNRLTWVSNGHNDFVNVDLNSYGGSNSLLNFGPYQYVVTIPAGVAPASTKMVAISKLTFTLESTILSLNAKVRFFSPHHSKLQNLGDKFIFVIHNEDNKNFQSYYLTVADCTSRDANRVCQACQSGLVRNNLMPDNNCVPASDYTGYVADTVNLLLSLCPGNAAAPVGVGCRATDCTGAGTTTACTTCDVANNFYLLNGVCYAYASIPDGYGIVTAGQQALAACTDTNCLKCVANKITCTRCKDSLGYYMRTSDSLCVHTSAIADGLGANLATYQYEACVDSNCQKCAANKNTCTQCKTVSGFYKNIGNDLCQSVPTVTDTYGFNSVTSQFEPCADTNCQKCAANKNTCTQCQTVNGFYLNIGNSLCETVPTVTDTYGFNSVTSQFEPCTDTNCQKCATNKNTCTQCKTGFYKNIGNNLCESVPTVTDTYGFNSVTSQFEPCTDTNCQKCAANKNTCTQCKTVSGFYMNIGNNLCESVATATDTYGFNSVSSQFEPCTDTNCQKCAANKNTCTQCKTVGGIYLNIGTSLCETVPTVTDTYGFNSVTSQFEPCTDTNCQKCAANKNTCTQCKTVSGFYMNIGNNLCESVATATDTYGFNSVSSQFESCTDVNCQKCAANKNTCTQCKTVSGFYMNIGTSVCETVPTVTDTYGFNSVSSQFEPCTDTNCQKCAANKNTCTQCKTVSGFYLNIGTSLCETVPTVTDTYGFNSVTSQFEPCTDTNCQKCAANKNTCTQCKTLSGFYKNIGNDLCESVATATDTYGFNSVTSQFELCTDTNCQKCAANKNTCTQCKTVSGFYMNIGTSVCETVLTVTDTYGFNSVTSQFELCTDTNCQKCAANKNTCTQCKTVSGFYKNIGNNLCESVATATDTYGFNSVTSQFELCTDTNCQKCAANKNTCTQCKTVSGFYKNIGNNLCESVATATDTYGFNSVSSQFELCTDTNCQKCAANKNTCTQCKTVSGFYMNIGTSVCETVPTVTDTYGFNSVTSQFEPCTDTNCQKCAANKNICTQCKTVSGFYMNIGNNLCQSLLTVSDSYGFNSLTNQFESCTLIGCQKCAADKTVCTQQCDVGNGFYFNIGTSVCETVPTVTDTYGFNSVTTQFEPCTDSNCQKCAANKNTCTQCKTVSGFYKNIGNNLCESVATATDTYGFNSITSQFELCTDTNCQKCAANKNTCTQCKTVSGFYMNIGTSICETVPTVTDTYGFNSVTSQFELCTDTNCLKCAANKNTCTQCKTVSGFYKNIGNNLCESVATATDTYGFNSITSQFEPCTDTNCQKCAANKNTCTQCKTISGFYKNIGNNLCESVATATDTYGFNSVTSQFELCTDTNCQKCAANKNICTQCKTVSGFYMNIGTSVCETVPTVTDTYGFNSVTSQFETCTDPNCQKCAANKNICNQCKVLAGVYINIGNNRCETVPTATDTYGFNSVSSQFEPCTDTNCQKCAANKDTCTQCKITSGWYWNGAISQCESVATATDTYGLNSVTNQFQSCVDVNCQKCAADFNQCSICINGFRVFPITKKCMTLQDAPDGYGAKDGDPAFSVCSDNHCLKCKEDYSICTDCQSGYQISLIGSSCVPSVPKDPIICRDRNCLKCASDYKICTECDQANGYVLVNGTCHKLTIITTAVKPTKADVDLSWKQQIADTPIQVNTSKVYKTLIANKVKYKLTATDNSDLGSYSFTIENYDQHVILDFTMPKGLPKEQYNVTLVGFTFNMTEENGTNYQIQVMNGSTVYYQKKSESELQAALLSILTLTMAAPDSATGLALMGTLLAADPTGTFFRFTKILQIVNKLYFININYGKRLEAFLAKSALPDKVIDKEQENQLVYNSRNNRAKLSKEKVTLSGISMPLMMYKIIFYVLSWLLRGVKRLLIDNCIMGKVGIYFCHYANKVHLIIFNLVFIDFIWLAPRTLMHSRGLSDIVQQSTIFVMCLIAADLCLLLAHLLDDRIWRKALEHYTSLQEFVPAPDPSSKEKKNDSSMNALKKPDQPSEQDGPNQPQTKQINYKRTYFEIDFNVHLMDMATNTLSMTKDVVDSMIVRLLVAQHWLLVPSLQLTILSTQYANCFGITIMLAIELSKLFATIYAYLKYKYLKNIICLLMEVSQAICLILFFFAALLISPKRFDEIILDFYQDAGIWIVIASCVAEYLLLLTYIGVAAYDFFKNRKMMKKMNVQRRTYAFLKFDESHRDVGNRLQTTNEPTRLPRRTPLKKINVAMKSKNSLATNNPQLPKFDGETKQPRLYRENRINGPAVKRLNLNDNNKRWMNKSLKRKQIE